ncbi:methyl-accepting chemotaxis protein [Psychrobacillus sp.]|uniref:methyl-accepting chemotaxis protein n=1 Tax=Psychrobacillus sp. TaxID=1871623 RepID=UPI0028BE92F1|nr:methyl-accepting chemotaxis protein [Psychrobacillus sp.]
MKKRFMLFKSLKGKLISSFSLMLIIPSIIIGTLSYTTAKEAVSTEIISGIEQNINLLSSTIDNTITTKMYDVNILAEKVTSSQYMSESSPDVRKQFVQYSLLHPESEAVYLGTNTGLFILEPAAPLPDGYDPRERDWYKDAIAQKGKAIISDPYVSASTKNIVVTISQTTKDGSGVIAIDIALNHIQQLVNQVKIGDTGYALLLDGQKNFLAHPTAEIGSAADGFYDKMYKQSNGEFGYSIDGQDKIMDFITNELTGWKIGANVFVSEINEAAAPILQKTIIVILVAFLIGSAAIFFIIKSIIQPIKMLQEKAITISNGDLTQQITIQSDDEIGHLGQAFNDMQQNLRNLIQKVEQNAELVASSSEQLSASAEQTSSATEMVATSIQEVARSAEKQTDAVDTNAQSLAEVSKGVSRIAEHSLKVSELTYETTTQAEIGGQAVTNTVNQMTSIHASVIESNTKINSLSERSKEVRSILNVITGIAEQTNLLALNAAIEAARAGEHGKGFAVVADEVRKLAEQSQQSAKEIHEIVIGIQEDTESSVQIMEQVTNDVQSGVEISNEAIDKFNLIVQSMKAITPQMEEVSATAQQVSAAIQETTVSANDIAIIAQGNAATSEEVAASAEEQLASMEEISSSAQALSFMADELKELLSQFKY